MSIKSKSPEGYGVTTRKGYVVILSKILDDRADIITMANLACLSYAIAIEENKVVSGYGVTSVFGYAVTKPCLKDYPSFQEKTLEVRNQKLMFKIEDNFDATLTPIESVCALRNIECNLDDELLKIDPDVFTCKFFMQESEELNYRWDTTLDQGEPWDLESENEQQNKEKHGTTLLP
nr:hypothetical protein [Tanacetum cinerariifolium]